MNDLSIEMARNQTAFQGGDEITGTVRWRLEKPPREVELRLYWSTRGAGMEDVAAANSCRFENPQADDSRSFRILLPEAPYSFIGKAFSIVWALELVPRPGKDAARVEIVMGPDGQAVSLT